MKSRVGLLILAGIGAATALIVGLFALGDERPEALHVTESTSALAAPSPPVAKTVSSQKPGQKPSPSTSKSTTAEPRLQPTSSRPVKTSTPSQSIPRPRSASPRSASPRPDKAPAPSNTEARYQRPNIGPQNGNSLPESTRCIQQALTLTVDGRFGQETYDAVKQFQQENGLSADGIVGPDTGRSLIAHGRVSDFCLAFIPS